MKASQDLLNAENGFENKQHDGQARFHSLKDRISRVANDYGEARLREYMPIWTDFAVDGMLAVIILISACYIGLSLASPFAPLDTLRHYAAYPNCNSARSVGLAPAGLGTPGYWEHLDPDRDGIACESWDRPQP